MRYMSSSTLPCQRQELAARCRLSSGQLNAELNAHIDKRLTLPALA